jgi:hypothetical protein
MEIAAEHQARSGQRSGTALLLVLAGIPLLALVLLVHGLVPGLVNDGPWDYLIEGDMRCLSAMGSEALTSWCDWYGNPNGYPFLSSGPVIFLGWALMDGLGLSSYAAYLVSSAVFDAVALAGGYGLMRVLGAGRVVALGTSVVYLLAPTTVGMLAFGGTFTGFTLLPTYALVDLLVMRAFASGGRNLMIGAAAGYAAVKTGALFLDGYSFVMSALLSAALWIPWLLRGGAPGRARALGLATLVGGHLVAVLAYNLYAPAVFDPNPLAVTRSLGLDLSTLVEPTDLIWGADLLGIGWDHGDLWGDGTNSIYNYVGFACVVLAVVAVATRRREPYVWSFAVAGVLALVLALGPSLKVGDAHPPAGERAAFQSYLMPEGAAIADLPWAGAFTLPGLETMRATYRWSGLLRLALIVLAALAIDRLARQRRTRLLAGVLAALAVVEIAPNAPTLVEDHRDNYANLGAVDAEVVPDLAAATRGSRHVFFLSSDGTPSTDYLVNYLAMTSRVRAFNAGGDKNALYAQSAWPQPIGALARPELTPAAVRQALASGSVDVVIAPYFHTRWAAQFWPPRGAEQQAAKRRYAPIVKDRGLAVRQYRWFSAIRLRRG